jgi:hypothetical protein
MTLPAGRTHARFGFVARLPAAFTDVRLVVTHGAVVSVLAREADRRMEVGVSTTLRRSRAARCVLRGRHDVCDQQQEACPILSPRWVATVVKRSAAPARIRVTFFFARSG